MKYIHTIIITVTVLLLCALGGGYYTNSITIEQMVLLIAALNGTAIIGYCIIKLVEPQKVQEQKVIEKIIEVPTPTNLEIEEPTDDKATSVCQEWSHAMYKLYVDRWNEVFENIKHPIDDQSKSDIILLCWDIASKTMDLLCVDNNDQNVLERNKNSVENVLSGKTNSESNLKEYFDDPSTVPAKVIGVHDTLITNILPGNSYFTQIFGYHVELSSQDE